MFDHLDDSLTNDQEFTPVGLRRWSAHKAQQKVNRIAKVIIAAGEFDPVDIIGLVEVENRKVLNMLVYYSPLKKFNYALIHRESPDRRGIDVALLYNNKKYKPLKNQFISPILDSGEPLITREILYSKGVLNTKDTIHIFINHWPSRYGGELESKPLRCAAAKALRRVCDSLLVINSNANIVIMGDFNDYPNDESLQNCLGVKQGALVNLAHYSDYNGSYKYQGRWGFLDQVIVSRSLYERKEMGLLLGSKLKVVKPDFILEKDEKYTGYKPFRTFIGYKYNGGYSDHLPVMIILK